MTPDPFHSASRIQSALAASGHGGHGRDAGRLAAEIAARGGLDRAAALANDEAGDLLALLLLYRAALDDQADPARQAARLLRQAQDLDARAEAAFAEGAQFAGRAAARRLKGDLTLAGSFSRQSTAAESLGAALQAEAFDHRLKAAQLQAEHARRADLAAALEGLAA